MFHGVQFGGDSFGTVRVSVKNLTGQTLTKGGIYALDLTKTNAKTLTPSDQLHNLVGVNAANKNGVLVVAESALANGDEGLAIVWGPVALQVDGSGSAVAAGDPLKIVVPGVFGNPANLVKDAQAAGNTSIDVAKALDACTLAVSGANPLVNVLFNGLQMNAVVNPATT